MSKKPPKAKAKEPCKPGKHVWGDAETTNGWVIHWCSKCPEKIERPRDKSSSGKRKGKTVAVAATILAALLPVSAAKCGGGQHQGLPVHSQKWCCSARVPASHSASGSRWAGYVGRLAAGSHGSGSGSSGTDRRRLTAYHGEPPAGALRQL